MLHFVLSVVDEFPIGNQSLTDLIILNQLYNVFFIFQLSYTPVPHLRYQIRLSTRGFFVFFFPNLPSILQNLIFLINSDGNELELYMKLNIYLLW